MSKAKYEVQICIENQKEIEDLGFHCQYFQSFGFFFKSNPRTSNQILLKHQNPRIFYFGKILNLLIVSD